MSITILKMSSRLGRIRAFLNRELMTNLHGKNEAKMDYKRGI